VTTIHQTRPRTRTVGVQYTCTDTIGGFCGIGSTPYTWTTWLQKTQTDTFKLTLGFFILTTGVELPVPKLPGVNITWYGIDPKYQEEADNACRTKTPQPPWPPFVPPATSK
jgi:hypothetical protein